jgi:hypothetical protein
MALIAGMATFDVAADGWAQHSQPSSSDSVL